MKKIFLFALVALSALSAFAQTFPCTGFLVVDTISDPSFCRGDSSFIVVSGGISYVWSPSTGLNTTSGDSVIASPTVTTIYTVVATSAGGCLDSVNITITVNSVSATVIHSNICCFGTCNATATCSATGNGPFTYSWTTSPTQSALTATGLCAGNYTVYVTDTNGCSGSAAASITQPAVFNSNVNVFDASICSNECTLMGASSTGGTAPYSYSWVPGNMTTANVNVCPTTTTTYTLFSTDSGGCCISNVPVTITVSQINVSTTSTPSACSFNTGTASAGATGGSAPYTYNWSNGQTTSSATGLGFGNYTVTVTDNNGCVGIQTVDVFTQEPPHVIAGILGHDDDGGTYIAASGGVSYSWYPAAGLSCMTCPDPIATPETTTTYCVDVTDVYGCINSSCVIVVIDVCDGILLKTLLPNAFSPNGDSENESYCVPDNTCITDFELQVYDRWGEKVFQTVDRKECWDGTFGGEILHTGVFTYFFKATLINGDVFTQKGNISLIR